MSTPEPKSYINLCLERVLIMCQVRRCRQEEKREAKENLFSSLLSQSNFWVSKHDRSRAEFQMGVKDIIFLGQIIEKLCFLTKFWHNYNKFTS